ncbi:unnamed protein product [Gordionus sp. m RMFG-2023]|uniref:uncharacterized protein LOC135925532 n=1 Tax=Gordionus sp. m RMFG-2023 TaxID=3053472 RepID=UPI0030E16965
MISIKDCFVKLEKIDSYYQIHGVQEDLQYDINDSIKDINNLHNENFSVQNAYSHSKSNISNDKDHTIRQDRARFKNDIISDDYLYNYSKKNNPHEQSDDDNIDNYDEIIDSNEFIESTDEDDSIDLPKNESNIIPNKINPIKIYFSCSSCGTSFTSKSLLKNHILSCQNTCTPLSNTPDDNALNKSGSDTFVCPLCPDEILNDNLPNLKAPNFEDKESLANHICVVHREYIQGLTNETSCVTIEDKSIIDTTANLDNLVNDDNYITLKGKLVYLPLSLRPKIDTINNPSSLTVVGNNKSPPNPNTKICYYLNCGQSFSSRMKLTKHIRMHHYATSTNTDDAERAAKHKQTPSLKKRLNQEASFITISTTPNNNFNTVNQDGNIIGPEHYFASMLGQEAIYKLATQTSPTSQQLNSTSDLKMDTGFESSNDKMFFCPTCQRSFTCKSSLRSHVLNVHDKQRSHPCEICNRTFHKKSHLNRHLTSAVHSDVLLHRCEYCGLRFDSPARLHEHLIDFFYHKDPDISRIPKYVCYLCTFPQVLGGASCMNSHLFHSNLSSNNIVNGDGLTETYLIDSQGNTITVYKEESFQSTNAHSILEFQNQPVGDLMGNTDQSAHYNNIGDINMVNGYEKHITLHQNIQSINQVNNRGILSQNEDLSIVNINNNGDHHFVGQEEQVALDKNDDKKDAYKSTEAEKTNNIISAVFKSSTPGKVEEQEDLMWKLIASTMASATQTNDDPSVKVFKVTRFRSKEELLRHMYYSHPREYLLSKVVLKDHEPPPILSHSLQLTVEGRHSELFGPLHAHRFDQFLSGLEDGEEGLDGKRLVAGSVLLGLAQPREDTETELATAYNLVTSHDNSHNLTIIDHQGNDGEQLLTETELVREDQGDGDLDDSQMPELNKVYGERSIGSARVRRRTRHDLGDVPGHRCRFCGKSLAYDRSLKQHVRAMHPREWSIIERERLRRFSNGMADRRTRFDLRTEPGHLCEFCGKTLAYDRSLKQHIKNVHRALIGNTGSGTDNTLDQHDPNKDYYQELIVKREQDGVVGEEELDENQLVINNSIAGNYDYMKHESGCGGSGEWINPANGVKRRTRFDLAGPGFLCDFCGKTLAYDRSLKQHVKTMHREEWDKMKPQSTDGRTSKRGAANLPPPLLQSLIWGGAAIGLEGTGLEELGQGYSYSL